MLSFSFAARLISLAAFSGSVIFFPIQASATETRLFEAEDGLYTYQYPVNFALDHEFADGTGDVTGVTGSSMTNGDVVITFLGPWEPGNLPEVSEQTQQTIVDEFKKSIAVTPKITFKSSSMTTMLGKPAVDMTFLKKMGPSAKDLAVKRYVFTVVDGSAYNFECIYREDKAEEFAPACDLAVSTVKFGNAAAEETGKSDGSVADKGCTTLEFNRRTLQVVELTSNSLLKDHSPAAIESMRKTHEEMTNIETRAGSAPSEQDCKDIDAIIETLK